MSPDTVAGGAQYRFNVTITNRTDHQDLGSANVNLPDGFAATSVASPDAGTATLSGNVVQLRDLDLPLDASVHVTVTAEVRCAAGNFTWLVETKQANDFSGPPGNDFGPQVDSSVTTSVTGVGCAAALRFVNQPANVEVNKPIGPVSVEVVDATNTLVTGARAVITMGLAPGSGLGMLHGTTTVTAAGGLATFDDLSIDAHGSYALLASSPGLTSATSNTFRVDDASTICVEDVTCTATLSNANAMLGVDALGDPDVDAGLLAVNRDTGKLNCEGYSELSQRSFSVDYIPDTGSRGRAKVVTLTIDKATMNAQPENGAAFLNMCFEAPFTFDVKPGTRLQTTETGLNRGLLPDCGAFPPPCVSKRNKTQAGQGVIVAMAPGGPDDPRYNG